MYDSLNRSVAVFEAKYAKSLNDLDTACEKAVQQMIETYENRQAAMCSGAVDHIAIDVKDIEAALSFVNERNLNNLNDCIHFLPFWENGVKYFKIEGPNKEIIEFSQIV